MSERWRFKLDDHISARRYALGIEPSVTDKGLIDALSDDELKLIEASPESIIPGKLLSPHLGNYVAVDEFMPLNTLHALKVEL